MSRPRLLFLPLAAAVVMALAGILLAPAVQPSGATFTASSASAINAFSSGDWTGPVVSLSDPGTPLRGSVTLTATATDSIGTVASVTIQRRTGAGAWTTICVDTSAPYACAWDTTAVADGTYDLRAVAVDGSGNSTTSEIVAARQVANSLPGVTLADPGSVIRGSITLTAEASAPAGVRSVVIQRSLAGADRWTDICTDTASPYACAFDTTKVANDLYDFRAIVTDTLGGTTTSAVITDVEIDNLAPTVSVTDPGSPLSGVVTVAAPAADAGSGVAKVVVQIAPAGTGTWTTLCTDTTSPHSCRWDTTAGADGTYDLRAVATDAAGNTTTSSTVAARRVDNSVSTVSMEDPGDFLRGTVTLTANAASTTGVVSVAIQRAPAGTATWTTVCTDTTAPYSCSLNTATAATPDGLYDLRAVLTVTGGATFTSATVAARRIDNTAVRGFDVQGLNKAGGIAGRVESGDQLALTWTEAMKPATLVPGWTGAAPVTVHVRLRDGAAAGSTSQADVLDIWTNAAATGATGLGSVNLGGDFVRANRTVVFTATAALGSVAVAGVAASRVTLTLGTPSNGGVRTWTGTPASVWTPSATATDLAGNASSAAPVTESGTADRDF